MRDSWTCEHDIGAIGASEPFKVCTEVQTFIRRCAAQHARVWSISARLQEHLQTKRAKGFELSSAKSGSPLRFAEPRR